MANMDKVKRIRDWDGKFVKNEDFYRKYTMALTREEQEIILKLRARKARKGVVGSLRRTLHV